MSTRRTSLVGLPLMAGVAAASALVRPVRGAYKGVRRAMGTDDPFTRHRPGPDGYDSPQWRDGMFWNKLPAVIVAEGNQGSMAVDFARKGDRGRPGGEIPVVHPDLPGTAAELAATWLGHSTVLIEIAGHWVLVDPVWSDRTSPSATIGPRRSHPVPMGLEELPELSAVLISHDHYDHLDTNTIDALTAQQAVPFVVPLGIGEHLRRWGVPADRIVELDWDQQHTVTTAAGDLRLICTEARHFSGRGFGRNNTLWSSWALDAGKGRKRRSVFFGGDTGYTPAFADIGRDYGPFDLTVLPIGAYDERWSDIHMNPAEAVRTHLDVQGDRKSGGVLLPIHWATFDLAFHRWAAPIEWLTEEATAHDVRYAAPRPGERFDAAEAGFAEKLPTADWWTEVAQRRHAG